MRMGISGRKETGMNKPRTAGRDLRIEIARIIGCLIVIACHMKLSDYIGGGHDTSRLFISCLAADGVAVFWLILGCFLFSESNTYLSLIKRTVFRVAIPAAVLSVILFVWGDFIAGQKTFAESITGIQFADVKNALRTLIRWDNPLTGYGYLWYIYVYLLLMICFPLIKPFVTYIDATRKRSMIFLIISFCVLVVNDVSLNEFAQFSHHAFNGVFPAAIEVIWGHLIWKNRDKITAFLDRLKAWKFIILPVLFFGLNAVRLVIQIQRYKLGMNNELLYWYSSIGLLCAVTVILSCLCIRVQENKKRGRLSSFLLFIAKHTFLIYLIHIPVRDLLSRFDLIAKTASFIRTEHWWGEIEYTILITLIIFILSLLISMLITGIKSLIKKAFAK